MTIVTHIATFIIVWWLVLFMMLPIGVRTPAEAGQEREPGTPESAPVKPLMPLKLALTTVITALVWLVIWAADKYDWVSLTG